MSDNDGIDDALRNAAQLTAGMLARLGEAQSRASQQHAIDQEHAVTAASTRAEQQARKAAAREDLTSTGLVLGNPEIVEDFSGVVGDGGLGFDRVTVDGDGDVA